MADRTLASRLRERITIQERNQVDNGRGGRRTPAGQGEWRDVATGVFAEIIALRGGEALEHAIVRSSQIWRVTIRARPGITTAMRVVWGSITMDIKTAPPARSGSDELIMTCESGGAGS